MKLNTYQASTPFRRGGGVPEFVFRVHPLQCIFPLGPSTQTLLAKSKPKKALYKYYEFDAQFLKCPAFPEDRGAPNPSRIKKNDSQGVIFGKEVSERTFCTPPS